MTLDFNIADLVKDKIQQERVMILGFFTMGNRPLAPEYVKGDSNTPFANASRRNTGDVLRKASGRLFRSFMPNAPEGIWSVEKEGDNLKVSIGSRVPYARIHEFGGTINHPGGTPYMVVEGGMVRFLTKSEKGKPGIKITKAHTIGIPARPYLKPALQLFEQNGLPTLLQELKLQIMQRMKSNG